MKEQNEDMLEKMATMRTEPSIFSPVDLLQSFNSSYMPLLLDWMLSKFFNETKAAENKVEHMRNITPKV